MNTIAEAIKHLRGSASIPMAGEVPKNVQTLADKASRLLNYDVLLNETGSGILQRTLAHLEIEVLDRQAVYEYQRRFGTPLIHPNSRRVRMQAPASGFLIDSDNQNVEMDENQRSVIPSRRGLGDFWARTSIAKYGVDTPIPEFVLNKAVQIKEALPEVNLYVEHLVRQPDPFLVVTHGGEEFYVEVWEEPVFEGRISR